MSLHIIATLVSLLISGVALVFLNHTDAKRRRAYKLPAWDKPNQRKWAWWIVCLPLPILVMTEQWSALVMWATAISLIGWGLAVRKPSKTTLQMDETLS